MTPEQARADERAKVVAWLRREAEDCHAQYRSERYGTQAWLSLREQVETFHCAADAIERGDHHKEQGE